MTCNEFVAGFSDYYDGTADPAVFQDAEQHLADCAACRRYRRVVESGAEALRDLPIPELREDFVPRLQHRLYHVDQDAVLRKHRTASGTTVLTVCGISVFLSGLAWSPTLRPSAPDVELPPIVVSRPPAARPAGYPIGTWGGRATAVQRGLWDDAHRLFLEYSRLFRGDPQDSPLVRIGLEQGR